MEKELLYFVPKHFGVDVITQILLYKTSLQKMFLLRKKNCNQESVMLSQGLVNVIVFYTLELRLG